MRYMKKIYLHEDCSQNIQEVVAALPAETSVDIYQTTWRHMSEESNLHNYFHKNLKSQNTFSLLLLWFIFILSIKW
jgi:hypothetical protein